MIILLHVVVKAFDKIQYCFVIKTLMKTKPYFKLIKTIYYELTAIIILNGEYLKSFSLKSGVGQVILLPLLLVNIVLKTLTGAID